MKQLLLIILLFSAHCGMAQKPVAKKSPVITKADDLPPLLNILEVNYSLQTARYAIAMSQFSDKMGFDTNPLGPVQAASRFDSIVTAGKPANEESLIAPVYGLFSSNRTALSKYLRTTLAWGKTPLAYYVSNGSVPVYFCNKDGQLNLSISGVGSLYMLDPERTTSRQRAKQLVKDALLPALSKVAPLASIPGLKSIALTIFYSCKSRSTTGLNPVESITMNVPVNVVKGFVGASVTEDALYRQSEFYIREYDSESGIKRIELKAE